MKPMKPIAEQFYGGRSVAQIAAARRISRGGVYKALARAGVTVAEGISPRALRHYRDIPGFPGYRINRRGQVACCLIPGTGAPGEHWRPVAAYLAPEGQPRVKMSAGGRLQVRSVPKLVAEIFGAPAPDQT